MHWIEIGSRLAVLATLISVNASPTLAAPVSNVTIYTFGSIRDCGVSTTAYHFSPQNVTISTFA